MKNRTVGLLVFTALTAFAGAAAAEGPEVGLRLGYGMPMGDAAKDAKLSDGIKSQIPIWLDLGYRINDNLMAGLYAAYGIGQLKEDCPDGASCSASVTRLGLQAQYHLSPAESMDPWLGAGIGYEMATQKTEAGGLEASATFSGFEFLNLQGGLDFEVSEGMAVGPFLSFSVGQYSKAKAKVLGIEAEADIDDKALHEWLVLGVRGTFQL